MQTIRNTRNLSGASVRGNMPLSDDQLRRVAPSVFASEAHESRSERYAYIPTSDVLRGLRAEGFEVFAASQSRTRLADRREHTKHLLRLRHVGDAGRALAVGDSVPELVLLNSHDGSSSYQLSAGMFRLVCSNGLMVPESTGGSVKVQHSGNIRDKVVFGAFEILDGLTRVVEEREHMRALNLNPGEQAAFARAALTLRYEDGAAPVVESQILRPRRMDDRGADLWTTFNVTQENLIRGGLRGRNASGGRTSTREVTGIDQSVKLNRALWTLADEMRKLKAAA